MICFKLIIMRLFMVIHKKWQILCVFIINFNKRYCDIYATKQKKYQFYRFKFKNLIN